MASRKTPSPPSGTTTTKPLAAFTRLNKQVRLYKPIESGQSSSILPPTTILLCTWMNASPKHIDYYAKKYMALYPSAQIILVTISTHEFMFESELKRRNDVLEAVHAILAPDQASERLLVHAFSNGGGKRTYNVAGAFQTLTGKAFAPQAIIFDSAPGIPQFQRDIHALAVPARRLPMLPWLASMAAIYVTAAVVYVSVHWMPLGFWYELVWGPTLGLNSPKLIDQKTIMGFMYSKEDLAIDWEDVERWAKKTEENGYRVEKRLVEGAEHVQLFKGKGGEEAYWGFVKRIWGMGVGVGLD